MPRTAATPLAPPARPPAGADATGRGPAADLTALALPLAPALPRYQLLEQTLRDAIRTRRLPPGCRLPEERDLARQFAVSRGTVRRTFEQLAAAGLLARRHGRGTYVAEPAALPAVPLALVIPGGPARAHHGFPGELVAALMAVAAEAGAELLLREAADQRAAVEPAAYLFVLPGKPAAMRRLAATGAPVVAVDDLVQGAGIDSVLFDNQAAARLAAEQLIAHGHRQIAWVDPQIATPRGPAPEPNAAARYAGLAAALKAAHLPPPVRWTLPLDHRDLCRELPARLQAHPQITALLAFDETVAWGACLAAADLGRKVPAHLSIAGLRLLDRPPLGDRDWSGAGVRAADLGRLAIARALERVAARRQSAALAPATTLFAPVIACPGTTVARVAL